MKKALLALIFLIFLLDAVSGQQPKLILPMGHVYPVTTFQYSHNGKKVLTAAKFGVIKIWDRYSGMLLLDLKGSNSMIGETFFSPDSRLVYSTCRPWGTESYLWSALDGRLIYSSAELGRNTSFSNDSRYLLSFEGGSVTRVDTRDGSATNVKIDVNDYERASFSPDGKKLFVVTSDSEWKLFETTKGEMLASGGGLSIYPEFTAFSPNNRLVVFPSESYSLYLLDTGTGKLDSLSGPRGKIWSASFSRSGELLSTCSEDTTVRIWQLSTKRLIASLEGHRDDVWSAEFSEDERWVVTRSSDSTVRIWEHASEKTIHRFDNGTYETAGALSPDKKEIATIINRTPVLLDLATGQTRRQLDGVVYYTDRVTYSPNGKLLITGPFSGNSMLWDATTMKKIGMLAGSHHHSLRFSKDGSTILGESTIHSSVASWDAQTGQRRFGQQRPEEYVFTQISDDGRFVVWHAGSDVIVQDNESGDTARFHSTENSAFRTSLSANGKHLLLPVDILELQMIDIISREPLLSISSVAEIASASFFDKDKKILLTTVDSSFVWDASARRLLYAIPNGEAEVYEELGLVVTLYEGEIKSWDMHTGAPVSTMTGHKDQIITTLAGDSSLVSIGKDRIVKVWDPHTGNCMRTIELGPGIFSFEADVDFAGKRLMATNVEVVDFFDLETGRRIYSLLQLDTTDYLIHDEFGRFDGTAEARKKVLITCGDELITLQQFKDKLWVPQLAGRMNQKEVITTTKISELQICGLTPVIEQIDDVGYYRYKIVPGSGGLGQTVLYVNGIETKSFSSDQLLKKEGFYELRLPATAVSSFFVDGQDNIVTLKSFIADNSVSSRGESEVNSSRKQFKAIPKLYAVFIGVNDYNDDALDLKFAGKDAGDLASAVKSSSSKLLGKENVFIYRFDSSGERTAYPEKKQIAKAFADIGTKASPNDILLVFFAGHGVVEGEQRQFYFLTREATKATINPRDIVDVGISSAEMMEWMKPDNIKAQKRILVLDACNSGAAINQMVKLGTGDQEYFAARNDDRVQQLKQIDKLNEKSGLYVLSASASDQKAYEFGKYSQGLLTYSLLKVLKEDPRILYDNKYVNVSDWFNSSIETAGKIIRENNLSQDPQMITTTSFQIGIVDDEVISSIRLAVEKPLFAASSLQNNDPSVMDDDLGISQKVNRVLSGISSRDGDDKIIYAPQSQSSLAWTMVGRYTVTGDQVTVIVNLKRNGKVETRFEVMVTGDLDKLADRIVQAAVNWIVSGH